MSSGEALCKATFGHPEAVEESQQKDSGCILHSNEEEDHTGYRLEESQ